MYAHGHKRSVRAVARASKFDGGAAAAPEQFELVRRLWSEETPLVWKRRQAFLGPVRLMLKTGELTDAGAFLETQGWVPPGRVRRHIGPV